MKREKYVHRTYMISINIGPFSIYRMTPAYKLRSGITPYIVGFLYSLLVLVFGFLGFSIYDRFQGPRNSGEALYINSTGGSDITKLTNELDYNERTVYIFNNLLKTTSTNIDIENLDLILDIQNNFEKEQAEKYGQANIDYVLRNLLMVNIKVASSIDLKDVFKTITQYEEQKTFANN